MHKITYIPGDGTGPELMEAMRRSVEATGVEISWDEQSAGAAVIEKEGTPLPARVLESIRNTGVAIKGPVTTPLGSGFRSINVQLRKELDLYACVRPCRSYAGAKCVHDNVDILIVRENTEGLYAGIEFEKGSESCRSLSSELEKLSGVSLPSDAGISIKPISESGSRRITEYAFNYAEKYNRGSVTAVTKSNIMKFSDGLFQKVSEEVANEHSSIEYRHILVDNLCMQLVQNPGKFDVLVLPNLYGDIVSDLCAGLVGGLGMAPGMNVGTECAVFEATHGSAPEFAGKNRLNPTALILSGVLMLRYIDQPEAADRLEAAVARVIAGGESVTFDLKPEGQEDSAVGTSQMADAVIAEL